MFDEYDARGMIAEFRAAAETIQSHWHLAAAALRLSRIEATRLDMLRELAVLDRLVDGAHHAAGGSSDPAARRRAVARYLFVEVGYTGARDERFEPSTSMLHSVMASRVGIPIALSVLYMACAEATGLKTHGIGFPGHFLVGCLDERRATTIVDPFFGGRELRREDLVDHLACEGIPATDLDDHLRPSSYPEILVRMLVNLKAMYFHSGNMGGTLLVLEHLIALDPTNGHYLRERGIVHERLGAHDAARRDYEGYLEVEPDASDVPSVLEQLRFLPPSPSLMH